MLIDHSTLDHFGFWYMWSPHIMLLTIGLIVVYFLLIGPLRHRFADAKEVSTRKKVAFVSGLIILYIAQGSPLNFYGHHFLFSAHMVQMALLYLIMPPLLYIGTPDWLLRPLLRDQLLNKMLHFFTRPLIALIMFNALFSLYHMPVIFDLLMAHHSLHNLYKGILIFGAFMMWWPVVCPIPELNKLTELRKIAYIFADGVLITPACALIIFADVQLYSHYANVPQILPFMGSMQDQQVGGVLMKLIQEVAYGSIIAYIFFQWVRRDKPGKVDRIDELPNVHMANPLTGQ